MRTSSSQKPASSQDPQADVSEEHSASAQDEIGSPDSDASPGGGKAAPTVDTGQPAPALLLLALAGIVVGAIGGLTLVGNPDTRYMGLALVFFSGALSVWRIMVDDRRVDREALAQKDEKIRRLLARCEDLEDAAWELRESDERQASILSTLGDIVLRRDDNNKVVYANSAADAAFGPQGVSLTGQVLSLRDITRQEGRDIAAELRRPSSQPATTAEARQASADPAPNAFGPADGHAFSDNIERREPAFAGRPLNFGDVQLATGFGPRWYSRMDIHVRDTITDQPLVQTVMRDVTDRRRMEDELLAARHSAESSNEAKSRFLATVSHEIRTPLNGILGMATLLRDTRLTKEQTAYIQALETSGETLLLLIDEVLDFSKVEAGKLHIEAAPTRLTSVVENVVELLAPKAQAKGLEIGSFIAPDLPETVTLDATRARQILFNLAGNGVKFTENGGVSISVSGQASPTGGTDLLIEVRDTGIGFKQADADRLFEEFEQLDHGRARKFGGTGLGLAIARRLSELMGGSIKAEPSPGGGALFKVVLPVPEPMRSINLSASSAQSPSDADSLLVDTSIVLIGSGPIEMPLLERRLRLHGAHTTVLHPGDPALDMLLTSADLIVLDNSTLSDSAGWLATARLAGCTARAVVLVSPTERDRLERLREAGYSAYLIRPVRMESLTGVLEELLKQDTEEPNWEDFDEAASHPPHSRSNEVPARPLKLLVAEDNDINRLLTEALLRKLGHEASLVNDGTQAVDAALTDRFDAILMDLHMPGLDGLAAIQHIRREEDRLGLPETPIFIVTADVMEDAKQKAASAGAAGYLTKPLSVDAIQSALQDLPKSAKGIGHTPSPK